MKLSDVRSQLNQVYNKTIETSISVKNFRPKDVHSAAGVAIGDLSNSSIALKDVMYYDIYKELEQNDIYHLKFVDGGLLSFQYSFCARGMLIRHRLCYFPSPELPSVDEAPYLYEDDELYGDVIEKKIVRFPIRFDYDPASHKDVDHPMSHLTLGQYQNCRIPLSSPVSPNAFLMFILRNFYFRAYKRYQNKYNKRLPQIDRIATLTSAERKIGHFVPGR